ncbi:MAG: ribosomal protein L7/L12 [Sphingomonas sp.]
MFIPMPVLIAIGIAMMLLVGWALRSRGRDPLMGGGRTSAYRAPLAESTVSSVPTVTLPPAIEEQVRALMTTNRKIEAIRLVRESTPLDLKGAKDLVESME